MNFASDNWAGAHPAIAHALSEHAAGFAAAYGTSTLDRDIERIFNELFEREVAVYFVATGTAANALSMTALARPGGVGFRLKPDGHWVIEPGPTWRQAGEQPITDEHPVGNLGRDDCSDFCRWVTIRLGGRYTARLPTETEWEYACRGGPMADRADSAFDYYFARPKNVLLPESANFNTAQQRTCRVGSYEANRLGAFDLHGNVHEWCADAEPAADGTPARVTRGGCWDFSASACTAAFRDNGAPGFRHFNLGFRVARVPVGGG